MNRGRSIPSSNFTPVFELMPRNPSDQSVTHHGQVSDVSVATPLVGTLLGNSSSISNNPSSSSLQLTKNTTAKTSNEQMMTTVITPTGEVGTITDSSINSMINTPSINNNGIINLTHTNKNKATPANGNPIKEKEKKNNPSPPVPTIQQKEKPLTEPNDGGRKPPGKLAPCVTTDLTAIANETQPKGETEEQKQRTKALFAAKRGLKEGEDPVSMFLGNDESQGGREKGLQNSFFCTQKHNPKTVGDENSTICTAVNMKEVDSKRYLKCYNLTHQTCSVKSKKCIFVSGEYSVCTDWSTVPWKHVWYCNMCAIRQREEGHEHVNITSMCSYCKTKCQEDEDSSMQIDLVSSKRHKSRRRGNK